MKNRGTEEQWSGQQLELERNSGMLARGGANKMRKGVADEDGGEEI